MEGPPQVLVVPYRVTADQDLGFLTGRKTRSLFAGKRVFPGGKLTSDSSSGESETFAQAAKRELLEETGQTADYFESVGRLLISLEGDNTIQQVEIMATDLTNHTDIAPQLPKDMELENITWNTLDSLAAGDLPADYLFWLPMVAAGLGHRSEEGKIPLQFQSYVLKRLSGIAFIASEVEILGKKHKIDAIPFAY